MFISALYEEARVFYHQFPNSLEGIDTNRHDDKFFMSWSGKRVPSSMVSVQLNSIWVKAVGHTKERPRISAILVRKPVVSKVRTQKLELEKDLADLMCHSGDTAKRSYFFQVKLFLNLLLHVLFILCPGKAIFYNISLTVAVHMLIK